MKNKLRSLLGRLIGFVVETAFTSTAPSRYASHQHLARALYRKATAQTVEYIQKRMPESLAFDDKFALIRHCLDGRPEGLVLEFGVFTGTSINFIAKQVDQQVHGFDSFRGLPESWAGRESHAEDFDRSGTPPSVQGNVKLHVGWFQETLPVFLQHHQEPVGFLHVDCDIYASTRTIFQQLAARLQKGSLIVFDEYFNYPGWQHHEYRAFQEYVKDRQVEYEYIGFCGTQVAVRISHPGPTG